MFKSVEDSCVRRVFLGLERIATSVVECREYGRVFCGVEQSENVCVLQFERRLVDGVRV